MKKYLYLLFVALFATMSFAFTGCSSDDDEPAGSEAAIIGTWEFAGEYDEDYLTLRITFKSDGKVAIKGTWRDYPEENYSGTLNYSIDGDLTVGARLTMSGKYDDGEYVNVTAIATIKGKTLRIEDEDGVLILTRK